MNNKINTSIQSNKYYEQTLRREIARQDIYKSFVLNANSIAPQQQRAYLLKTRNPVSSFIISVADTGKDIVELGKALVTGKSNDNQLGRFNDLGMKLGGLGIASYLFTRRGTGTKSLMEFVGAGAFFATMAAWPRLLISEPLKLRYGFDIRQQYIDAQGRKKRLYLDNQFVPDLYSDKEIDKIADKMGVDKSNPEYRELTKEKMRTIALQGNTLWMLSAGFSPLLTSMICNLAERGITKYIVNSQYNKILNQTDNLDKIIASRIADPSFNLVDFKEIQHMLARQAKEPGEDFYRQISTMLDPFSVINNAKDSDDANLVSELTSAATKVKKQLQQQFNALKASSSGDGIIETDSLIPIIKRHAAGGLGDLQGNSNLDAFAADIIEKLIETKGKKRDIPFISLEKFDSIFKEATKTATDPADLERLSKLYRECVNMQGTSKEVVEKFCKSLEKVYSEQTRPISAQFSVFADFLNGLVGQKYESLHTSIHLNSIDALMDSLDIPYKELRIARNSISNASGILQGRLAEIASDDTNYEKLIGDLTSKQAKFESGNVDKLLTTIKQKIQKGLTAAFENIPDDSPLAVLKTQTDLDLKSLVEIAKGRYYDSYQEFLAQSGKQNLDKEELIEFLKSKGVKDDLLSRAPLFKRIVNLFVEEKGAGIRATGHRYILEADFERRLHTGELQEYWKYLTGQDTISDEVLKICRSIIYEGSMNDLANKFYMDGNGVDPVKILKLLFADSDALAQNGTPFGLAKSTYESCDKTLLEKLIATRENFYKIYAQMTDYARLGHNIAGVGTDALQKTQYSMLGRSGAELFMDTAGRMFNDKHWMRIFGTLTGVVVGLTLFTQLFFGKAKNEHLYNKKENGGVNASK